ncbi:leucine-rich repeat-containing protein 1-like [Aedes albopictus]|uniref:Uncharacterized protein n=1 Tax=Aedes albopictus TaxID=7160 RepID=A0ABM1Z6A3_AEDAL
MKGIPVTLLFIAAALDAVISFSVQKHANFANAIDIHQFHWLTDATLMERIPDKETLFFEFAEVDVLPQNFTDRFEKCIRVSFTFGSVKIIHIIPKLRDIELFDTSTENVIIGRGKHYRLENFKCNYAKLTSIPDNISQLKKMKNLDLSSNLIQTVQLDHLNGLDHLETLYLFNNKIKRIFNHRSVSLASLTDLHLEGNQLKHLDVCSWNMPKLSNLGIAQNNLTHFAINHFRALKELLMDENPLNCAWGNKLLQVKSDINIKRKLTCVENSEGVFELDCPSRIDQLRQQISTQIEDSSREIDHLKQQNPNFDFRLAQIEGTILNNSEQFAIIAQKSKRWKRCWKILSERSSNSKMSQMT